jgi:predicted Zn-dependent peptidase
MAWRRRELSIAGDFDSLEMKQLLEQKLGTWQNRVVPASQPLPSPLPEAEGPVLYLVDRPGATQVS